jgi:hypothetical protein
MTEKKLKKINSYYTCKHQELAEKSCGVCNTGTGSINIKILACSKCKKSMGNIFTTSSHGTETHYRVELDCYQKDDKTHACVGCHEKNKDDNQEREREREDFGLFQTAQH